MGLSAIPAEPAASATASIDPKATVPAETGTAHEIRISPAESGNEGLEFSARLTEDGGLIQRPIAWKLHRLGGETVFAGSRPVLAVMTEPGDYLIEASYGSVHAAQSVALLKGRRIAVTLVLNVGGIRILSRLSDIGLPDVRPFNTVYATSGPEEGKLVSISEEPGEVMRLAAGTYRVESRFAFGNAIATAEVTVKPGLLSSVEIDHHAGIAHLSAGGDQVGQVNWTVSDDRGRDLPVGSASDVVLLPGRYVARAEFADKNRIITFTVEAGKRIEVVAR
jgi:hypothetical protein